MKLDDKTIKDIVDSVGEGRSLEEILNKLNLIYKYDDSSHIFLTSDVSVSHYFKVK